MHNHTPQHSHIHNEDKIKLFWDGTLWLKLNRPMQLWLLIISLAHKPHPKSSRGQQMCLAILGEQSRRHERMALFFSFKIGCHQEGVSKRKTNDWLTETRVHVYCSRLMSLTISSYFAQMKILYYSTLTLQLCEEIRSKPADRLHDLGGCWNMATPLRAAGDGEESTT